jgi:hypothetical protein
MKLALCREFKKNQISNLMKILPVGSELLHMDGRTDMMKVIVTFSQFCERA